jgi:SPP1 family predicted phage head-tail adaptor
MAQKFYLDLKGLTRMRSGRLNQLLTIQEKIKREDNAGGFEELWVDACQAWGGVKKVNAGEELIANHKQGFEVITFELHYDERIKIDMRVKDENGLVFEIISIFDPSRTRQKLEITTKRNLIEQ